MGYIPFHKPHLPKTTISQIKRVLDSGWITTGPQTKKFEQEFQSLVQAKNCVAVSSCTAALHLSYLAVGLKVGDEVIVPSFTFCSAINAIIHTGATPVFCDIKEDTLCVDPEDVLKKITKSTKAIVVVHYAGMPADMDAINKIAKKYHLKVIEDAAHAFYATYRGKFIGESSNIVCFSFYATKNLTTAEGGMVVTSNEKVADLVRCLSFHGISKNAWKRYDKTGSWKYDVIIPGYKYNMTDIQAVIGIEQLKIAERSYKNKLKVVNLYKKHFAKNPTLILPIDPPFPQSRHAWHLFPIRITKKSKITRDVLIEELKKAEIGVSVHFIPNHQQKFYKKNFTEQKRLPVTEKVFKEIISLPLYEDLTTSEILRIANTINKLTQ